MVWSIEPDGSDETGACRLHNRSIYTAGEGARVPSGMATWENRYERRYGIPSLRVGDSFLTGIGLEVGAEGGDHGGVFVVGEVGLLRVHLERSSVI